MTSKWNFVWVTLLMSQFISTAESAQFGDFCNETIVCDVDAWLVCDDSSTCSCINSETMAFDHDMLKCVGKPGQKCRVQGLDASEGTTAGASSHPLCGSNSTCGPNMTCACDPGSYVNEVGLCQQLKNFSERCSKNADCQHEEAYLTCINGTCGCDATKLVYNAFRGRLANGTKEVEVQEKYSSRFYQMRGKNLVVEGEWLRDNECTGRGFVLVKFENELVVEPLEQCVGLAEKECNPNQNCAYNASRLSGICACDSGFIARSDHRCGADYKTSCNSLIPCADGLNCVRGTCRCPQFNYQFYNKELKKCVGLPASFCSADSDCMENAVCVSNQNSGRKQCSCSHGFSEQRKYLNYEHDFEILRCNRRLGLGELCDYHGDTYETICANGLECVNGQCACADSMTAFDENSRKCLGLVGAKCDPLRTYTPKVFPDCVHGATCFQPNEGYVGRCICNDGYEFTSDGFCKK